MMSYAIVSLVSIVFAGALVALGAYCGIQYGGALEQAGQKRTIVVHRYENESSEAPTFDEAVEE